MTHEFLSLMLNVRRAGVNEVAIKILGKAGFIKARRGVIIISGRLALEKFAIDSYGDPKQSISV